MSRAIRYARKPPFGIVLARRPRERVGRSQLRHHRARLRCLSELERPRFSGTRRLRRNPLKALQISAIRDAAGARWKSAVSAISSRIWAVRWASLPKSRPRLQFSRSIRRTTTTRPRRAIAARGRGVRALIVIVTARELAIRQMPTGCRLAGSGSVFARLLVAAMDLARLGTGRSHLAGHLCHRRDWRCEVRRRYP